MHLSLAFGDQSRHGHRHGHPVVAVALAHRTFQGKAASDLQSVRAFFDLYDAATQLGILPGRGTLGEKALLMVRGFGLRASRSER